MTDKEKREKVKKAQEILKKALEEIERLGDVRIYCSDSCDRISLKEFPYVEVE